MNRSVAILAALSCVLLTPVESRAQSNCTRADLQSAVDSYLAAQGKGTPSGMRLAPAVKYSENDWLFNADNYLKYSRGENRGGFPRHRAIRARRSSPQPMPTKTSSSTTV